METGAITQDACICSGATGWQRTTGAALACEQVIETRFSHFEVPVTFDIFHEDISFIRTNFKSAVAFSYDIPIANVTLKYHAQGNPAVKITARRRMLQTGPIVTTTSVAGTTVLVEANVYKSRPQPAPRAVLLNLRNVVNAGIVEQTNGQIAQENGSLSFETWMIILFCILLCLVILCFGVVACRKHRQVEKQNPVQGMSEDDRQIQMYVLEPDKVVGRYDVADNYDPFDVHALQYAPGLASNWHGQ